MIGICISSAWDQYYASSPYLNLLRSNHPGFVNLSALPHETLGDDYRKKVNECAAILTDDVLAQHMHFYKNGPKLLVGGDIHAHSAEVARRREDLEFNMCDYVLSGGVFAPKMDRYFYVAPKFEEKLVYLPNSTPDLRYLPKTDYSTDTMKPWKKRKKAALLSGSMSEEVYPYRMKAARMVGSYIEVLPPSLFQHGTYFEVLSQYKAGITCNSLLKYTVAKYFEIPWVGSLLLAPSVGPEMDLLGFKHEENAIFVEDPTCLLYYILEMNTNPEAYEKIQQAGTKLVHSKHTVYSRLDYIESLVDRIVEGGFLPQDAFDIFKSTPDKELS